MRFLAALPVLAAISAASFGESPRIDMPPGVFVSEMPTGLNEAIYQLTAAISPVTGIQIVGPREVAVGQPVRLSITGLPAIDGSKTLDEALAWLKTLKLKLDQPPEVKEPVPVDVTVSLSATPNLAWRVNVEFTPPKAGDYVLGCDWNQEPFDLILYRVRAGGGPVPPPPPDNPILSVLPEGPLTATGPIGGPWNPPAAIYTVANAGTGNLEWRVRTTMQWLDAVPSSGVLASGQAVEVTVSFNEKARELGPGRHLGIAHFTNLTNGTGTTARLASLTISETPPITKLWAIIIEETRTRTAKQAQVLSSLDVRSAVEGRLRIFDRDNRANETVSSWIDRAAGKPLPYLFLSGERSGTIVWEGPMPETIDAMLSLIRKYTPRSGATAASQPSQSRSAQPVFDRICTPEGCIVAPVY